MDYESWIDAVYIYSDEYKEFLRQEVERIASQGNAEIEDFNRIDLLRPGGLSGLQSLVDSNVISSETKVLEVGSGLGGNCRFLTKQTNCNCYGLEYFQSYVEISTRISEVCGMSQKHQYHQGDATTYDFPENEFDVAIDTVVLCLIPGDQTFYNIYRALKPGGLFYFEDYVLTDQYPDQMTPEYREVHTKKFPLPGTKTYQDLIDLLQRVGFQLEGIEEYTRLWSERTWSNAEALQRQYQENPDTQDKLFLSRFNTYGKITPTILNDVGHFTPEQLQEKFPLLCAQMDFQSVVWNQERKMAVYKIIARKPSSQ